MTYAANCTFGKKSNKHLDMIVKQNIWTINQTKGRMPGAQQERKPNV